MATYKGQQTKEVDGLIPVLRSRTKKAKDQRLMPSDQRFFLLQPPPAHPLDLLPGHITNISKG